LPVKLVYSEAFTTKQQSVNREQQIKKWSQAKKQALINADKTTLKNLSRSTTTKYSQNTQNPPPPSFRPKRCKVSQSREHEA
jgi:hypothetical protein